MEIVFYNRNGRPVAYTEDRATIYLYNGEPVACLEQDSVYAFSGRHLGWFVDGWILDVDGNCVFFSDLAMRGPTKPAKMAQPAKGVKRPRPAKGYKEGKPSRSAKSWSWSSSCSESFFQSSGGAG